MNLQCNQQARKASADVASNDGFAGQKQQQGVTLLFLALLVLVGMSGYLLNTLGDTNNLVLSARSQNQILNEAREALLGYAIAYPERNTTVAAAIPGYLPCPDRDGDGLSDNALCGAPDESAMGFLPWQTLGLSQPKPNECLFYAVSAGFKSPDSTAAPGELNSDTDGSFQIEDDRGVTQGNASNRDRAIAVVFLPGEQLVISGYTQVRSSSGPRTQCGSETVADQINLARNYLDRRGNVDNATGVKVGASVGDPGGQAIPSSNPSVFVVGPLEETADTVRFNDQTIWISSQDYEPVRKRMNEWVLAKVHSCVAAYGDIHIVGGTRRYPWPAMLNSGAIPNYNEDANQRFGRIPLTFISPSIQWENEPGISPAVRCFSWPWWANWREQVFMAVADAHTDVPVGPSSNIELDGSNSEFVVLLANRRLASQVRDNYSEQGQIDNYLELDNIPGAAAGLVPPGDEQFITSTFIGTFNDLACSRNLCTF